MQNVAKTACKLLAKHLNQNNYIALYRIKIKFAFICTLTYTYYIWDEGTRCMLYILGEWATFYI